LVRTSVTPDIRLSVLCDRKPLQQVAPANVSNAWFSLGRR